MPISESKVMHNIMLALAGVATVFRNNIGAHKLDSGGYLKYGVGGKGGSDLLGWRSMRITPQMVGAKVAVFVAIEVKAKDGSLTKEQEHFLKVVNFNGGLSGVARSPEEAMEILGC